MGHPRSTWKHKKYPARDYVGSYAWDSAGERQFVLTCLLRDGKKHRIVFESHEAAKNAGWMKR